MQIRLGGRVACVDDCAGTAVGFAVLPSIRSVRFIRLGVGAGRPFGSA